MTEERQVDLFLDGLVNAPLKDDRALMEFPFFSLQKAPRMRPLVFDDGRVRIEVRPGDRGIATIWDKDVLIYLASILNDRLERGLPVERTVRFSAHNLLQVTGRGSGKRAYELLLDAMFRLRSTTIVTTIEAGEARERRGFGWIETFRVVERAQGASGRKVMAACEITLNDWMSRAIAKDRRVLTISPRYFSLGMGLKRRLYELARKHCGQQERWVDQPAPADRQVRLRARAPVLQAAAQARRHGRRPARLPRRHGLRPGRAARGRRRRRTASGPVAGPATSGSWWPSGRGPASRPTSSRRRAESVSRSGLVRCIVHTTAGATARPRAHRPPFAPVPLLSVLPPCDL